jgi:hypothetical protein
MQEPLPSSPTFHELCQALSHVGVSSHFHASLHPGILQVCTRTSMRSHRKAPAPVTMKGYTRDATIPSQVSGQHSPHCPASTHSRKSVPSNRTTARSDFCSARPSKIRARPPGSTPWRGCYATAAWCTQAIVARNVETIARPDDTEMAGTVLDAFTTLVCSTLAGTRRPSMRTATCLSSSTC